MKQAQGRKLPRERGMLRQPQEFNQGWVRYLSQMLITYRSEVGDSSDPNYRQQVYFLGNALYRDLITGIGKYRSSFRRSEIEAVIEGMRQGAVASDAVRERFIEIVEEVMGLFEEDPFASDLTPLSEGSMRVVRSL